MSYSIPRFMLRLYSFLLVGVFFVHSEPQCSQSQSGLCEGNSEQDPQYRSSASEKAEQGPALLQTRYAGRSNTDFFEEDVMNSMPQGSDQIFTEPPWQMKNSFAMSETSNPTPESRNELVDSMSRVGPILDADVDQRSRARYEQPPNFMSTRVEQPQRDRVALRQPPPLTGTNDPEEEIEKVVDEGTTEKVVEDKVVEEKVVDEDKAAEESKAEGEKTYETIESNRAEVPKEFPEYSPDAQNIKVGEWVKPEKHDTCTPVCTWSCNIPKCDEVCTPVCQAPKCETRCSGMSTYGCVMACAKPHCMVMCPKHGCPAGGCPSCTTQCSEPECHMKCPKSKLCKSVCEHPQCEWNCKAPECPKPTCHMVCESPKKCGSASFSQELPPLVPGQTAVQTFVATVPKSGDRKGSKPMSVMQPPNEFQQMPWTPVSTMDVSVRSLPPHEPALTAEPVLPTTNTVNFPVFHEQPFDVPVSMY